MCQRLSLRRVYFNNWTMFRPAIECGFSSGWWDRRVEISLVSSLTHCSKQQTNKKTTLTLHKMIACSGKRIFWSTRICRCKRWVIYPSIFQCTWVFIAPTVYRTSRSPFFMIAKLKLQLFPISCHTLIVSSNMS